MSQSVQSLEVVPLSLPNTKIGLPFQGLKLRSIQRTNTVEKRQHYPPPAETTNDEVCPNEMSQANPSGPDSTSSPSPVRLVSSRLGHGSFRSKSRFWVDRNPRSRENIMRSALEDLLGKPFPKARPAFLRNPATNRCLELDAYCEALRCGAEFSGEQHRVWPNSCHSTRAEFDKQQQRDQLKIELCRLNAVSLLIVPDSVSQADMKEYVRTQLIERQLLPQSRKTTTSIELTSSDVADVADSAVTEPS